MEFHDEVLVFHCGGMHLFGILSLPQQPHARGVLVVVGGPQYRVGSHRQFLLLARHLAVRGISVLRFDYRGMGDSEGDPRTFEAIQDDIAAACDAFLARVPQIQEIVLWGLCDAASAALLYAPHDSRVTGIVLLNPWVRTAEGEARTYLKHYYLKRLTDPELWHKIRGFHFDYAQAARGLLGNFHKLLLTRTDAGSSDPDRSTRLPERMVGSLSRFPGRVLLILSGNDLVANEFREVVNGSKKWRKLLGTGRVTQRELAFANHTFSRQEWRDQVMAWTAEWVASW